jgi:hypothetical protein
MAKYAHADLLDGGLNYLVANADKMILLKTYADADNYTAVNVTNNICEVAMTSGDFTLGGADNAVRTCTSATKSATATGDSGGAPSLHIAFVDTGVSKVLLVTDETTDVVVTTGNTVNFPEIPYTAVQPT